MFAHSLQRVSDRAETNSARAWQIPLVRIRRSCGPSVVTPRRCRGCGATQALRGCEPIGRRRQGRDCRPLMTGWPRGSPIWDLWRTRTAPSCQRR